MLIPFEKDKYRSIGMYSPLLQQIDARDSALIPLKDIFKDLPAKYYIKWVIELPLNVVKSLRISNLACNNDPRIKKYRTQLITDTLLHSLLLECLKKKLNGYKAILVDWDRHRLGSLIIAAGNLNGQRTYTFVHGAMYTPSKFVPLLAKYCLTWSDSQAKQFEHMGASPDSLVVTGNPRFNEQLPSEGFLKNKYGVNDYKVILYASQNFPDFKTEILISLILQVLENKKRWKLIVKPHPAESEQDLERLNIKFNGVLFLDKSVSTEESLALCDFVVLVSSTFAIDSLFKNRSVLLFKPWINFKGIALNLHQEGARYFSNAEELHQILTQCEKLGVEATLNKLTLSNFLMSYCSYIDRESAKKIAKALSNPSGSTLSGIS